MDSSSRLLCDLQICRLCAQENKHGACLFPREENDTDLSQIVNKYLPLKVERDGKFPIFICPGCNIQLEATKQFLDLIIEGQKKLHNLFKTQQDTLQRQEKQRQALETALKTVNPNSSVAAYTIDFDESGEKFIIQILSEGPLFPPDHEFTILLDNTEKPKRKRGRPQKTTTVAVDKLANNPPEDVTPLRVESAAVDNDEDVNVTDTRRKRKIKVPSRFQEAVQGKELERIFKEEGVGDDSAEDEIVSENSNLAGHEDEVIGHIQTKEGIDLGEVVINGKTLNKNKNKYKERLGKMVRKKYVCQICGSVFLNHNKYDIHKATHNKFTYECAENACKVQTSSKESIVENQNVAGRSGTNDYQDFNGDDHIQLPITSEDAEKSHETNDVVENAIIITENVKPDNQASDIPKNKFSCEICLKQFTSKQNYEIHDRAIHKNHRPYKCNKCEKSFAYISSLKSHMLQHDDKTEKYFTCETCKKSFNHPSSLVYHREAEHNNGQRFVCNKCNKGFKHRQLLHRHQLVHSNERPHSCKQCKASFKTKANLLNHMPLHTGEKKYYCLKCNQSFAHRTSLTLHMRWHNGQKPYQCEICMKSFSQKGNLAEHKRIHTGEKPYNCETCGRKFTTSSQCKLHTMRHTGVRPWRCEYCAKTFLHKDTWKCHTRRHRNERPYECPECLRGFTEQWALKKHARLHTGEKPYVCDICKKSFADCSNLTKHKKIHDAKTEKLKPRNIKVLSTTDAGSDQQVLYLTYQDSNSNDSQMQTLVHIVDDIDNSNEACLDEKYLTSVGGIQHFVNEEGEALSLTTADGCPIKVLNIDQQENLKHFLPNGGILLPITTSENENSVQAKIEENDEEPITHVLRSDMQFLNEDYEKLNEDIHFLTEDGNICFVTSYNVDETLNVQYM